MKKETNSEKRRKAILQIVGSCTTMSSARESIKRCWNLYNGVIDKRAYKHITHSSKGKHAFPSRLKNIDKLKSRINYLEGNLLSRPFPVTVSVFDQSSVKSKQEQLYRLYMKQIESHINTKTADLQNSIRALELRKQLIAQSVQQLAQQLEQAKAQLEEQQQQQVQAQDPSEMPEQQEPQPSNEGLDVTALQQKVAQLQEGYQQAESYQQQLFSAFDVMEQYLGGNIEELGIDMEEIKQRAAYSFTDMREEYAQVKLQKLRRLLNIEEKGKQAFRNGCVDGNVLFLVDYNRGSKAYTFEPLSIFNVYYPTTNERHVEDCPWVVIKDMLSPADVLRQYDISDPNKRIALENMAFEVSQQSSYYTTSSGGTLLSPIMYGGTEMRTGGVDRYRIYYVESRKVGAYKDGDGFKVSADASVLGEKEDAYSRVVEDLYLATFIGDPSNPFFERIERKEEVVRHPDRPSRVKLPIVGNTFNHVTYQPFSLAWNTKELIELNNIVFFTIEKLNNLSGVKGNIMDISQKPDDMSLEDWEFKKQIGRAVIQTRKKGVNGFTYNQFQSYDDTMSDSIARLFELAKLIDQMFDMITGISRQSMSQITQRDGKATTQMAIEQSDQIVEVIYWNYENILTRAMNQLLNLALAYDNDSDEYIQSATGGTLDIIRIPKGIFKNVAMELICKNSSQEETRLKELKQVAMSRMGLDLDLDQIISLFTTDTLKTLEKRIRYYAKKNRELAQQSQQNGEQAKAEAESQRQQLLLQFQAQQNELDRQLKGVEMQIKQKQMQIEDQKLQLLNAQIESQERVAMTKAQGDMAIKSASLQEQQRHSQVDELINQYKVQTDVLLKRLDLLHQQSADLKQQKAQSAKK